MHAACNYMKLTQGCAINFHGWRAFRDDPDWAKLKKVPGLLDPWNEIRDKFNLYTEEFKVRNPPDSAAIPPA